MDKVLIYKDSRRANELREQVATIAEKSNYLIRLYESFQPWEKVTTRAAFEALADNPQTYFDRTIVANCNMTAGGMAVDPEQAARLFNVERDNFLNLTMGIPLADPSGCKSCGGLKIKKGEKAITSHQYNNYKQFLLFSDGAFSPDVSAIDEEVKKFDVFAESENEIALVNHYADLIAILNTHAVKYGLNDTQKQQISKPLNLMLSQATTGSFMTNIEHLKNQILNMRYGKK